MAPRHLPAVAGAGTTTESRLAQEKFHSVSCGCNAHADTVGALSVLRAGPGRAGPVRRDANPA